MNDLNIKFISVDYQYEFAHPQGRFYNLGHSVEFINSGLIPFLEEHHIAVNEIISDYRLPRHSTSGGSCDPNTEGYISLLPDIIRNKDTWIKAMHNPTWVRINGGIKNSITDFPYPNPEGFCKWLKKNIGEPSEDLKVIIFGLTMEVCVFEVVKELYFRGYKTMVLYEATDPMNERLDLKDIIATRSQLSMYTKVIFFNDLIKIMSV